MPNDTTSTGGSSSSADITPAALEQLRQLADGYKSKYEELQTKVAEGKLVDPAAFLERKVKDGEYFPKDRFVGLQQTFQTTQTNLSELQGKTADYEKKISKLEEDLGSKGTELDEKDVELETLRRGQKRASIIFTKFPELASFEAEGLLPEAEDDVLETTFDAFAKKLGAVKDSAAAAFASGGTPPTPPKKEEPKTQTAKTHLAAANEALVKGDFTKYNEFYDKYLDSLNAQP
jgi:hypothetical protein